MGKCFSGSESKSVSTSYIPAQRTATEKLLETYMPMVGKGAEKVYQGERVAPMSAEQQGLIGQNYNLVQQLLGQGEMPLYGQTGQTLTDLLTGQVGAQPITPEQTEAYYKRVYEEPAQYNLKQNIIPATQEAYAGPNYWSGARAKAQTQATGDVYRQLGEQRGALDWATQLQNQQLAEQQANRQLSAVSPAMTYGVLPQEQLLSQMAGLQQGYGMAALPQQQEQAVIQAQMQKFAEENNITDPDDMAIIMGLLNLNFQYSKSRSFGEGLGYSILGSPQGAAMGIAGAGAMI